MQRDLAARSEWNRQHSADGSQNNRPDDETTDNHNLSNQINNKRGDTGWR